MWSIYQGVKIKTCVMNCRWTKRSRRRPTRGSMHQLTVCWHSLLFAFGSRSCCVPGSASVGEAANKPSNLEAALMSVLGKKHREIEHVDLNQQLSKSGLDQFYGQEVHVPIRKSCWRFQFGSASLRYGQASMQFGLLQQN